jgi:hypothetical protein
MLGSTFFNASSMGQGDLPVSFYDVASRLSEGKF